MPLSLESAQTLALGPFNPHIISPSWLIRHKVCEGDKVEVRFLPLSQGVAFSIDEVQWHVDLTHLLVSSRQADCGALVAKVLALLIHTPVQAIGNNFHYACSRAEWGASPLPMLGSISPDLISSEAEVEQTRWSCVFRAKDDARIEVTVSYEEQGVVTLFNFHREANGANVAAMQAGKFAEDRAKSHELIRKLFGQGVAP